MLLIFLLVAASSVFEDVDSNPYNIIRVCAQCESGPQCTHDPYICATSTTPVITDAVSQATCGKGSSGPKCTQDFDICPTPVTVTSTKTICSSEPKCTLDLDMCPTLVTGISHFINTPSYNLAVSPCHLCYSGPLCTRNVYDEGCNE